MNILRSGLQHTDRVILLLTDIILMFVAQDSAFDIDVISLFVLDSAIATMRPRAGDHACAAHELSGVVTAFHVVVFDDHMTRCVPESATATTRSDCGTYMTDLHVLELVTVVDTLFHVMPSEDHMTRLVAPLPATATKALPVQQTEFQVLAVPAIPVQVLPSVECAILFVPNESPTATKRLIVAFEPYATERQLPVIPVFVLIVHDMPFVEKARRFVPLFATAMNLAPLPNVGAQHTEFHVVKNVPVVETGTHSIPFDDHIKRLLPDSATATKRP
jgi:hypothetical protein